MIGCYKRYIDIYSIYCIVLCTRLYCLGQKAGQSDALYPVSQCFIFLPSDCLSMVVVTPLVPSEVNLTWPVGSLFDQGLVKLSSGAGVDVGPAELAVVLQTGDVSAEKGSKFSSTACTLAFITQLIIQDVGLYLHLHTYILKKTWKLDKYIQ